MDTLDEFKNVTALRSPSRQESTRTVRTPQQQLSRSPTSHSGRNSPGLMLEMSVTEQIARKTRKSTVLDQKNALMILAIPDYDDYKILQPYSCRSLSNKTKFIGGRDFITRHNPQEVNDFKMQYSRDVGNLNRHRSVLAPPNTLLADPSLLGQSSSSKYFLLAASQTLGSLPSNQTGDDSTSDMWRRVLTTGKKACWILTEYGINKLIGPEYSISTRLALTTAQEQPSPLKNRSPLRPPSPSDTYSALASARVGFGVDLSDELSLGRLSRTAAYSPASRPPSPPRSPYREPAFSVLGTSPRNTTSQSGTTARRPSPYGLCSTLMNDTPAPLTSTVSPCYRTHDALRHVVTSPDSPTPTTTPSPTLLPFAIEVSPPRITLDNLAAGEVYLFPVRVRNVGTKQERYRVKHLSVSAGGSLATIAEASYDRDSARLAPGLATIVTVTLSFARRGHISGQLQIDTEGVGSCHVAIDGTVR